MNGRRTVMIPDNISAKKTLHIAGYKPLEPNLVAPKNTKETTPPLARFGNRVSRF